MTSTDAAAEPPKKTVTTKRSTATLNGTAPTRKRAALGDVSNVAKTDGAAAKDGKKATAAKGGQLAKAAHPTKVQKPTRSTTTRSVLKEKSAASSELKRPASGSGIAGHATKRRATTKVAKEEDIEEAENVVPPSESTEKEVEEEEAPKAAPAKQERVKDVKEVKEVKEVLKESAKESVKESTKESTEEIALPEDVPDLDKEDVDDPLMVSEYVVEIFDYLKELEIATMANPDYMDSQNELEWKMRGILVDWLLEVHTRFRLLPETLFLAVNIIDRFLSTKIVQLDRLQLVGVTAMFIASKYEEVLSPHVQNFRHVADDGFTEEEILSAERFVLAALNYDLSYPNPMNFLRRISKADNYDIQTRTLGKYLLEIGCLDHRFIAYPPSQVAAASMYLARLVLERGEWVSST